jgi:hypothetical protein
MSRIVAVVLLTLGAAGCFDNLPADAGPGDSGETIDVGHDGGPSDAGVIALPDANNFVDYDAGPAQSCAHTCECPQGQACTGGVCRTLGVPVYCCDKAGCPGRETCLDEQDLPGECNGPVNVPDSGVVRADAGPQPLGGECGNNVDCQIGLVCWTTADSPLLWDGYCTVADCGFGPPCPSGSECLRFDEAGLVTACLKTCSTSPECRQSAACFLLPGAPFAGVCIPDCRDDLVDCFPKDGSARCDATLGLCVGNSTHDNTADVGDPCGDSSDCAAGEVCMGEAGWGFSGGMCTRDCSLSSCASGESCQTLGPYRVCFKDCVGGQCPNRPGASCTTASPTWPAPACVP